MKASEMRTMKAPEGFEVVCEGVDHPADGTQLRTYALVRNLQTQWYALIGVTGEVRNCPQDWAKRMAELEEESGWTSYGTGIDYKQAHDAMIRETEFWPLCNMQRDGATLTWWFLAGHLVTLKKTGGDRVDGELIGSRYCVFERKGQKLHVRFAFPCGFEPRRRSRKPRAAKIPRVAIPEQVEVDASLVDNP